MRLIPQNIFILLPVLLSSLAFAQRAVVPDLSSLKYIDPKTVLMSPEYTFQDQEMVNEVGRMVMKTPHKMEKVEGFVRGYLDSKGLAFETAAEGNLNAFKAGYHMNISPTERWYVDSEPVCIEVNHSPRNIYGVAETAPGIYSVAKKLSLVPYVNPAAERSGMGHIHVGGATLGDSPFFKNPLLLRNVMVYFHKHPSLLWGFAEAYDVGSNSNIESLHIGGREQIFEMAVNDFDTWWSKASAEDKKNGMGKFLEILYSHGGYDFFHHYRAINLEHLKNYARPELNPQATGKITVEFRDFRPPKSPQHAISDLVLLLKVFDFLAKPNYLVKFEAMGSEKYQRFFAASKVAADWEIVRKQIGANDILLDEMINEYVDAVHRYAYPIDGIEGTKLFAAYSEKNLKGTFFEVLIPTKSHASDTVMIGDKLVPLEKISINGTKYWTGVVDVPLADTLHPIIKSGLSKVRTIIKMCHALFQ